MAESREPTIYGYRKIKKVGEGTFGITYHVTKNGTDYALKMLKSFQMTEKVVNEAMREITILRSLKHGNVVSYVESFRDESLTKLYIVMEYCDIGNLGMLLNSPKLKAVEEGFIVFVMTQLCCGMEYLHSKKVIHRDIKPTNIFMKNERSIEIKIGDFGLSKVLQSSGFLQGLPSNSQRSSGFLQGLPSNSQSRYAMTQCGTPGYISPECSAGLPYNFSSDMWAVGRVLYDLCNIGAESSRGGASAEPAIGAGAVALAAILTTIGVAVLRR